MLEEHSLILFSVSSVAKIDKRDRELAPVGPGSYNKPHTDLKKEPSYR